MNPSPLYQAYCLLAQLSHEAWNNPLEVPMPFAMMLLHSRDYVGRELHEELAGGAAEPACAE
jgi:hypothetical protein